MTKEKGVKKLTKKELIERAKELGFFKKPAIKFVWARENGHFYYNTPPSFIDGLESYKITREDVEVKKKKVQPKK